MSRTTHQGTVATFTAASNSGTVIDDDGYTYGFGDDALSDEVRTLRPGQRVCWQRGANEEITRLTLVTLSL